MKPITVVLADDHALVREGMRELLERQPDIRVIGEAGNGYEALKKVKSLQPDILVLDIMMPRITGIDVAQLLQEAPVKTKIIVVSMYKKKPYVRIALQSGARAYVLKTSPGTELVEAVRAVCRGQYFFSNDIKSDILEDFIRQKDETPAHEAYDLLTQREQQVFRMIAEGNTIIQISDILCISPKTVEKHRTAVMKKLNLAGPLSMIKYAVKMGIVDLED